MDVLGKEPPRALRKAVEARLAAFYQHKDTLLEHLHKSKLGSKSRDVDEWWPRLTHLAQLYFLRQGMTPPSERVARLHKLARILEQAHVLAKKAAQDDLGCDDLLSIFFNGTLPRDPGGAIVRDEDGSLRAEYFPPLEQMVANLAFYRTAVLRAADDVPVVDRKPAILPPEYISELADVFRTSTGREPGAGRGPFTNFLMEFRAALGPSYKTRVKKGAGYTEDSRLRETREKTTLGPLPCEISEVKSVTTASSASPPMPSSNSSTFRRSSERPRLPSD